MIKIIKKTFKKIGILIAVLIILVLFYVSTGSGKPNTQIDYIVQMNKDTHKFDITMTIKPNRFFFLDLFIDSPRNKNGDFRVTDFTVTRDNRRVAHWKSLPSSSSFKRLWVGFSKNAITVTYTVDPHVAFGNRGKMLSYLTDQYGYLRGKYIIYEPIDIKNVILYKVSKKQFPSHSGVGSVLFDLPEGWQINDPWVNNPEKVLISDLTNTYWALGQDIKITKFKNLSIGIIDKMDENQGRILSENIKDIYEEIEDLSGFKLKQDASYWTINILPPIPIHGGASGNYSLLTENSMSFISHEIFHWWNGITLTTDKEANWIDEGFTKYYEGKLLLNTGIWSDVEFNSFIENTNEELFLGSKPKPINLIDVSNNYIPSNNSMEEFYKLYNGGALLAYYIDKKLQKEQKSLDEIWLELYKLDKVISSEDFLDTIEDMTNRAFRDEVSDMINGKIIIPLE